MRLSDRSAPARPRGGAPPPAARRGARAARRQRPAAAGASQRDRRPLGPAGWLLVGLPEEEVELRGVMLDVTHVVQKHLHVVAVDPLDPAAPAGFLGGQ